MNDLEMNLVDNPLDMDLETTSEIFDYNNAINKPTINNVELKGNKTSADLGLQPAGNYITEETDPVFSASASAGITSNDITNWNNKSEFSGSYDDLTDKPTIPDELSDLTDDSTHRLVTDTEKSTWNNKSDFSGSYNDLTDKPTIPTVPTNVSNFTNDAGYINKEVNNLTYYTLKTSTGSLIDLEINSSTYVITLSLKDIDGTIISTDTIDLPLESVVVGGSYDSTNKKIVLTLENGNTVDIPVGDLVAGLQTELTSTNKLNSDYVDDTNSGNKFVTTSEKSTWNAKYDKPSGGIPSTDLASAVQTSLGKADTALQSETYTGTITSIKMNGSTVASSGEANLGTVITQHQDISGKEDKTNKVTSLSSSSTDKQYPSAKCVYDLVGDVETLLTTLDVGSGV